MFIFIYFNFSRFKFTHNDIDLFLSISALIEIHSWNYVKILSPIPKFATELLWISLHLLTTQLWPHNDAIRTFLFNCCCFILCEYYK